MIKLMIVESVEIMKEAIIFQRIPMEMKLDQAMLEG